MHPTYIQKSTHAHNHKRLVLNSYHCFGRLFALQELWIDYDWARRCHLLCSVCRQWCNRPSRVNLVDPDIQSIKLTAREQFHPCLSQFKHWLSGSLIHLTKWSESSTKQKKVIWCQQLFHNSWFQEVAKTLFWKFGEINPSNVVHTCWYS